MTPNRGSFPRATGPETIEEKRARFEAWMIETAQGETPDPELAAILSQPNHDESGQTKYASMERCVRARCWQCVSGNEDDGARERIEGCALTSCALHAVRPYKTEAEEAAMAGRTSRRAAINTHCRDCQGGRRTPRVGRAVSGCNVVSCALWFVRPQVEDASETEPGFYTPFTAAGEPATETTGAAGT